MSMGSGRPSNECMLYVDSGDVSRVRAPCAHGRARLYENRPPTGTKEHRLAVTARCVMELTLHTPFPSARRGVK